MPKGRFEKGSQAAKEWGQKMREAKMKKMKGGMMGDDSDDELAGLTANMTMKDDDKPSSRPSALPKEFKKPVIKRRSPPLPDFGVPSKPVGKRPAETQIKKEEGKGMNLSPKQAIKTVAKSLSTNIKKNGPIIIRDIKKIMTKANDKIKGGDNGTRGMIDGDFSFDEGFNPLIYTILGMYGFAGILKYGPDIINYIDDIMGDNIQQGAEAIENELVGILDLVDNVRNIAELPRRFINRHLNQYLTAGRGIKKSKNIVMGGYLQPGEIPSAAGPEQDDEIDGSGMTGGNISALQALIAAGVTLGGTAFIIKATRMLHDLIDQQRQIAPDIEMGGTPSTTPELSPSSSTSSIREVEETGSGMLRKCGNEMSAAGIGKMFKKASKTFNKAGKKMNIGMAKLGTAVNPMTYALGNKKISKLMRQSGQVTDRYLLPAAVSAGLPLYYGAAGTAGMMLGGPLGALAATKAADTLWQEAVVKRGYDPRERQKSKILGAIAEKIGQAGASQYKAGMSSGKEKKITGGNLLVDMPERAFIELIEMLRISELVNLLNSLASPEAARRRQMVQRRIDRLRSQSPPAKAIIPSGASGKGMKKKFTISGGTLEQLLQSYDELEQRYEELINELENNNEEIPEALEHWQNEEEEDLGELSSVREMIEAIRWIQNHGEGLEQLSSLTEEARNAITQLNRQLSAFQHRIPNSRVSIRAAGMKKKLIIED